MSAETPDIGDLRLHSQEASQLLLRVQEALNTCSLSIRTGDFGQSERAVAALVEFLDSICSAVVSDQVNEVSTRNSEEVLSEIHRFVCNPSLDQEVADVVSFELPKAVAKFACVSDSCRNIAEGIVDRIVSICSPRDMLSILCEALDSPREMFKTPAYFAPLLSGLSKVFLCIQRRHFEQIKVAVPVILNVLKAVSSEADDEDKSSITDLLGIAMSIATSMSAVSQKLEGRKKEEIHALLGLFVLQTMALVSCNVADKASSCIPMVIKLSQFIPFCGLSYIGLITACDIDTVTSIILGDESNDYFGCFSFVKLGASLAVIWAHISDEVAKAAKEDLSVLKDKIRISQLKRWQTVGMLKHIFAAIDQPWELKKHAIDFLLSLMEENASQENNDEHIECSLYIPSLFSALQAILNVIMYASETVLRKNAFSAFKKVLADIPAYQRFDILKALIANNNFSSMVAILIDLVREEMRAENCERFSRTNDKTLQVQKGAFLCSSFWSHDVLELVELILKPPKGGPPSLPENSDAVLSALNLYRFTLMTESIGNTNYTGVLSETTLRKAYTEWLLPLRTIVLGIMAENNKDYDQLAVDTVCALNPIELVLYRCIELVEEKLKHSP